MALEVKAVEKKVKFSNNDLGTMRIAIRSKAEENLEDVKSNMGS
jgi:hypothetical protein